VHGPNISPNFSIWVHALLENLSPHTPKLHVGNNHALADAVNSSLISKELFVSWTVSHLSQKLYGVADKLKNNGRLLHP